MRHYSVDGLEKTRSKGTEVQLVEFKEILNIRQILDHLDSQGKFDFLKLGVLLVDQVEAYLESGNWAHMVQLFRKFERELVEGSPVKFSAHAFDQLSHDARLNFWRRILPLTGCELPES